MASRLLYLLAVPLLLLLRSKPLPSRETIIPPSEERVLLLGSSSGVGRDLAHRYAQRGAKLCLFARRQDSLETVKQECISAGAKAENVIIVSGDITNTSDLLKVRDAIVRAWGGIDTVHILAGVPSTSTLLDLAGVPLTKGNGNALNPAATRSFTDSHQSGPDQAGLDQVAKEARICGEINYVGTTLSLAAFLPLLASSSRSPALHHLSSVAATVPAPRRTIYAATKAAGLMAVESCRVECEGAGVRFLSLLPGTIANDFRTKTALSQSGGKCEVEEGIRHSYESLLLPPEKVVDTILHHLSLNPNPAPLIPFFPFTFIPYLSIPPKHLVHLPWQYRVAFMVRDTPLGWLWIEPAARRKYGIGQ